MHRPSGAKLFPPRGGVHPLPKARPASGRWAGRIAPPGRSCCFFFIKVIALPTQGVEQPRQLQAKPGASRLRLEAPAELVHRGSIWSLEALLVYITIIFLI